MLKRLLILLALAGGLITHAYGQTYPGQGVTINVAAFPYQADPTGVADATTAIQNAINALPASGGIVQFPPGTYKVSSTISVGNGSASNGSSKTGVILQGLVPTQADIFGGFTVQPGAVLQWAGAANGTMLKIAGPLQGWGVQNLGFNCSAATGVVGMNVVSAMYGDSANLYFNSCFAGISSQTVETFGSFTVTDSLHNNYRNLVAAVPNQVNAAGFVLQGSGSATPTSNTDYNVFDNVYCGFPAAPSVAIFCFELTVADSNIIRDLHSSGGNANVTSIAFSYQVSANFPASNIIYGTDPNGSIGTSFANFGTPNASAKPNYLFGVIETNGSTVPNLANLAVYGSKQLVLSPGGNNANTNLSPLTGAPSVNAGFCTSPSIPNNNGPLSFTINVGTACAGSTGTLTMPAAPIAWVCDFHDVTTPASNIVEQTGGTTTTVTLTNYVRTTGVAGNFTSSDVIRAKCMPY